MTAGSAARTVRNAPIRLTSTVRVHASGSVRRSGPNDAIAGVGPHGVQLPVALEDRLHRALAARGVAYVERDRVALGVDVGEHGRPPARRELACGGGADAASAAGDQHDLHASALIPVSARPMISFWICDVPSYSVVTRTSRK